VREDFSGQTPGSLPAGFVKTRATASNPLLQVASPAGGAHIVYPAGTGVTGGDRSAANVWEWRAKGAAANTDFRARVTIRNVYHPMQAQLGWGIGVRCQDAYDSGYWLFAEASGVGLRLRGFETVRGDEFGGGGTGPMATATVGPLPDGTYWLRLQAIEEEHATRVRAKLWPASAGEPAWQIDVLHADTNRPLVGYPSLIAGQFNTITPPSSGVLFHEVQEGAEAPRLDAPVTVHFSEALTGMFADPTVDATFFQLVDLPVGSRYALGDQLSSDDWYAFAVRDKSISGGLVTYAGETLLATLGRVTPTESLILVAGQGGVPTPLTLRECLVRFLTYYGVPFDPNVPEFSLRVGDELVTPTAEAFVIQPNQENPESLYEWLERFFGPFRGYTFRADYQDRLSVSPPAWLDTIGLRLTVHRRRQPLDREPVRSTVRAPWSTTRAPEVEWVGTVDGVAVSGSLPDPLVQGAAAEIVTVGGVDVRLTWDAAVVQAMVWPTPDVDVSVGSLYSVTFVFRPDATTSSSESLALTLADLAPDEVTSESADTVVNQAVLPVRRREFTPAQQIMQAGALVLRSPKQVMAGAFGANPEYGPMAEPLATPGSFLELANTVGQSGTWFWPADPLVVAQPGGNITVAFEVEEWAERWHDTTSHDAAAQVNTYSDTAALPASGVEVKLFDFQFPRQTNDFAPSPYGAQGSVYGRWRAGEQPGIEVRVGNARFAEFGFKPEVLIFGSTTYYLWGIVLKLNGTGTAFTEGTLETYRFGFARGANGLWEDGANVPGLSESQSLYPNRAYHAPELPYVVSPETALALARGIVEENLTPKVVRQLTIVPARADGYAVRPHHVGRAAAVPALGITGRITALDYSEAHTAQGSTSSLTIDVESTEAPSGSRAAARAYRRSAYGLSTYQLED